ncbi:hypothetical protein PBY51_009440 [Eleginops maclovinus]|uniref:Uncharacterized protein n=1 Tax=Eleginops maclovinus TaxID=56733 RepID=A0AAN8AUY5_ELEMC|nr:hypothetical protein PBY51_009440 [Eleginops maclovinus]
MVVKRARSEAGLYGMGTDECVSVFSSSWQCIVAGQTHRGNCRAHVEQRADCYRRDRSPAGVWKMGAVK